MCIVLSHFALFRLLSWCNRTGKAICLNWYNVHRVSTL